MNEDDSVPLIPPSVTLRLESDYLINKSQDRCKEILVKEIRTEEDIIDALIYLHIILEVGLNGLFRNISLADIKKGVEDLEIIRNLDSVNFIDKVTMFVYNSSFNFEGRLHEATEFHGIIGKLKNFAGIRNQLLHGHAILTIHNNGTQRHSPLQKQLNEETLLRQVKDFLYVLDGVKFYLKCLNSSLTPDHKDSYAKRYLSRTFIPARYTR